MTQAYISEDHYFGVLLEDMTEVKQDIRVIKFVIKDHNNTIDDHEARIAKLEAKN